MSASMGRRVETSAPQLNSCELRAARRAPLHTHDSEQGNRVRASCVCDVRPNSTHTDRVERGSGRGKCVRRQARALEAGSERMREEEGPLCTRLVSRFEPGRNYFGLLPRGPLSPSPRPRRRPAVMIERRAPNTRTPKWRALPGPAGHDGPG